MFPNVVPLIFLEPPSSTTIFPPHQLVNETGTFEIFCNATGNPPPTIAWSNLGDSSKVYPSGNILRRENVAKSDVGNYKCTAVSVRGENVTAEASVELDFCKSMRSREFKKGKQRRLRERHKKIGLISENKAFVRHFRAFYILSHFLTFLALTTTHD